ncbi:UNVERIFIED_ORG: hypothetical protein GGD58_001018 [Rhizobium pisi]
MLSKENPKAQADEKNAFGRILTNPLILRVMAPQRGETNDGRKTTAA